MSHPDHNRRRRFDRGPIPGRSRLIRETAQHRRDQREILEALVSDNGWRLVAGFGTLSRIDALMHVSEDAPVQLPSGRRLVLVEVKRRKALAERYPSLLIDLAKVEAGVTCADSLATAVVVAVGYDDGVRWTELDASDELETTVGGRTDRDDPGDIDELAVIPGRWMTPAGQQPR